MIGVRAIRLLPAVPPGRGAVHALEPARRSETTLPGSRSCWRSSHPRSPTRRPCPAGRRRFRAARSRARHVRPGSRGRARRRTGRVRRRSPGVYPAATSRRTTLSSGCSERRRGRGLGDGLRDRLELLRVGRAVGCLAGRSAIGPQRERERDDRADDLHPEHDRREPGWLARARSAAGSARRSRPAPSPPGTISDEAPAGTGSPGTCRRASRTPVRVRTATPTPLGLVGAERRLDQDVGPERVDEQHRHRADPDDRQGSGEDRSRILAVGAQSRDLGDEVVAGAHRDPDQHLGRDRDGAVGAGDPMSRSGAWRR